MQIIEKILDVISPNDCLICGAEGLIVCESCMAAEFMPMPSSCIGCAKLTRNFETCNSCSRSNPIKAVWVVTDYGELSKKIIANYKYDANRSLSGFIASLMYSKLPQIDCLITSVPTAPSRVRQRGFDHCKKIAKEVAIKTQLPYSKLLYASKSVHQVGSGKIKRINQTENLFMPINKTKISGKNILIVDDVVTTGATLKAVAKTLKSAGARDVYGLVFARNI